MAPTAIPRSQVLPLAPGHSPAKRGRPCAVLMPVEQARAAGRHLELMSLAGTGAGLWGGDSERMVREIGRPHAAGR